MSTDIEISKIDIYGGTQTRAATHDEAVEHYAECMEAGDIFPDILVYFDGSKYWLADGFHRFLAAKRNGYETISATVKEGTRTDALKAALSANSTNGLYRTNADKRTAVEIALEEWPDMANTVIADICSVSPEFVRKVRNSLDKPMPDEVVGRDGKKYSTRQGKTSAERLGLGGRGGSSRGEKDDGESSGGGKGGGKPKKPKGEGAFGGSLAEIEQTAAQMDANGDDDMWGTKNYDPHAKQNLAGQQGTAMGYAAASINMLAKIPLDDERRGEALEAVMAWIDRELYGAEENQEENDEDESSMLDFIVEDDEVVTAEETNLNENTEEVLSDSEADLDEPEDDQELEEAERV